MYHMAPSDVPTEENINDKIPVDIMVEIFIYCLPKKHRPTLSTVKAPLNLIAVCQSWRNLARKIPCLWTSLNVDHDEESVALDIGSMIKFWRDGAQSRPLSLWYRLSEETGIELNTTLRDSLIPNLTAVQHLMLSMSPSHYQPFLTAPTTALQYVESLELTNQNRDDDGWTYRNGPTISLGRCHSLRKLALESYSKFGFVRHMLSDIPWSQLTSLRLIETVLPPTRARDVLVQCTSLSKCEISVGQYASTELDPPSGEPAILVHLTALTVRFSGMFRWSRIAPLFEPFTFPILDSLCISAPSARDAALMPTLVALNERSRFPLRYFMLSGISVDNGALLSFLRDVPTIEDLALEAPPGYYSRLPVILGDIAYRPQVANNILPNLVSVYMSDFIPEELIEIIAESTVQEWMLPAIAMALNEDEAIQAIGTRCWEDNEANNAIYAGLRKLKQATLAWTHAPKNWSTSNSSARGCCEESKRLRAQGLVLDLPILSTSSLIWDE